MSERTIRIRTRNLGKDFVVRHGQDTAVHVLRRLMSSHDGATRTLRALAGVTFEVREGEMVGVVGNNGAGKTTLLRVVAGIYGASRGEVERRGDVALLSGLGVGMVPDLSVRENVYLYGAICRLSRARISALFSEIIEWAELSDFVGAPLRNLSTGMATRLAASIARHIDTPIILMDEALSAGDERFRKRLEAYFEARRQSDTAMLIASHSLDFLERFCVKALWLRQGEQVAFGPTREVLSRYRAWAS